MVCTTWRTAAVTSHHSGVINMQASKYTQSTTISDTTDESIIG